MTIKAWMLERDTNLAKATAEAQYLVGKTISAVEFGAHDPNADCENVLRLTFTDGTTAEIVGSYGSYTGESCDEYIEYVTLRPHGYLYPASPP